MSEAIELIVSKPKRGYGWGFGGQRLYNWRGMAKVDPQVPLRSMFESRQRVQKPEHELDGHAFYRVIDEAADPHKPGGYHANEVVELEPGVYRRFLELPAIFKRGTTDGERAILGLVSRYGLLQGPLHIPDAITHWETPEYWLCKSREMAEATQRREYDQLTAKHYRGVDGHIGALLPVTSRNTRHAGIHIAYRAQSLLGALWLQWSRDLVPYQGRCEVCDSPLIGRRGMKTCSDYCRKVKSLEKQR